MKRTSLHRLQAAACCLVLACAGEPSAPQLTPQYSNDDSHGIGWGQDKFPTLYPIAFYKSPPPNQPRTAKSIGPEGGSVRLGDFEIIVPPGAVSHPTTFHIVLPADPWGRWRAVAEIGPHIGFAKPITVILPGRNTWFVGTPKILWWDDHAWEEMPTTVLPDGRLQTQTNHLSYWGTYNGFSRGVITAGG